jgi:hypothetical protein
LFGDEDDQHGQNNMLTEDSWSRVKVLLSVIFVSSVALINSLITSCGRWQENYRTELLLVRVSEKAQSGEEQIIGSDVPFDGVDRFRGEKGINGDLVVLARHCSGPKGQGTGRVVMVVLPPEFSGKNEIIEIPTEGKWIVHREAGHWEYFPRIVKSGSCGKLYLEIDDKNYLSHRIEYFGGPTVGGATWLGSKKDP